MGIVLIGVILLAILALNLLCPALPFLIIATSQAKDKHLLLAYIILLVIILPTTIAVDYYIVSLIREVSRPDFA